MKLYHVMVSCDVSAKILDHPVRYRLYVNNELFTERKWIWHGAYLEEYIPIAAPAGVYPIRYEVLDPGNGKIKVRNFKTDVDMIENEIATYRHQIKHDLANEAGKKILQHRIQEKTQELNLLKQDRTVRIITYQGETAVEISNESK